VIAGWGLPSVTARGTNTIMKQITVDIYKAEDCVHFFGERLVSTKRMMCAAYPDSSEDSCAVWNKFGFGQQFFFTVNISILNIIT